MKDVLKFLATRTHLGGTNLDSQMEQYICRRKTDGIYIKNLKTTWEKLLLAAHTIVAIKNSGVVVSTISSRNTSLWAVLTYAVTPRAMPTEARFTSVTFTNQIQATSPCLLGVTDSRANHWPLTEVSYVNPRTIALWNRLSPMLCGHCYALKQVSSPSGSDVVDVS